MRIHVIGRRFVGARRSDSGSKCPVSLTVSKGSRPVLAPRKAHRAERMQQKEECEVLFLPFVGSSPQHGEPSGPEDWTHLRIKMTWSTRFLLTEVRKLASTLEDSSMAAEIVNTSIQPKPMPAWPNNSSQSQGALLGFFAKWSTLQYVITFLLSIVVYDQGNQECQVRG